MHIMHSFRSHKVYLQGFNMAACYDNDVNDLTADHQYKIIFV